MGLLVGAEEFSGNGIGVQDTFAEVEPLDVRGSSAIASWFMLLAILWFSSGIWGVGPLLNIEFDKSRTYAEAGAGGLSSRQKQFWFCVSISLI
jgi:hypothetical protein